MKLLLPILALALLCSGCLAPLKGGRSSILTSSGFSGKLDQSQNPQSDSTQDYERKVETDVPVKPGDVIVGTDDAGAQHKVEIKEPRTLHLIVTESAKTKIGAAQKDTAREVAAKLSSLKGIVWIGVLLFVFGVASAVYPPLKLIVGSLTTSLVCAAAGVALIVLPSLIVGNEILILSVAGGAVILYWFAHRHGGVSGELRALKNTLEK